MVTRTRTRTGNQHRENYSARENSDYGNDDQQAAQHRSDRPDEMHHDYVLRFEERLSDRALTTFQGRSDPMDFSPEHREEVISGWVEGFNDMGFDSANERMEAAQDIATSVFRPYHDRLDAREYEASQLNAEELFNLNVLMGANADTVAANGNVNSGNLGDGALVKDNSQQNYIEIQVDNLDDALRIIQESGGQARITYLERHHLQQYENRFADFLMQSSQNPDEYAGYLETALAGASAFTNGGDDSDFWLSSPFEWFAEREIVDDVAISIALDSAIAGNWVTFEAYLDQLRGEDVDVDAYETVETIWKERQIQDATSALNDHDRSRFESAIYTSGKDAADLLYRIKNNTGFIDHDRVVDYNPPELPAQFSTIEETHGYISVAAKQLVYLQRENAIEAVAYENSKSLLLEMGKLADDIDEKEADPSINDLRFEYGEMRKLAAGVDFFLSQGSHYEPEEYTSGANDASETADEAEAADDQVVVYPVTDQAKHDLRDALLSGGIEGATSSLSHWALEHGVDNINLVTDNLQEYLPVAVAAVI